MPFKEFNAGEVAKNKDRKVLITSSPIIIYKVCKKSPTSSLFNKYVTCHRAMSPNLKETNRDMRLKKDSTIKIKI